MSCPNPFWAIVQFTVTGGNEAGVDLVLIQLCLLHYVNRVVLMLTSIFLSKIYRRKARRFVSKQGQPQPHVHSKARIAWSQAPYWGKKAKKTADIFPI